ncbi:hypothetical protein [Pseudactinotalea sp. Z1732]
MGVATSRIGSSTFTDRIHREFDAYGAEHVGLIYASADFSAERVPRQVVAVTVRDIAQRLRADIPECGWIDVHDERVRLLVRGSTTDLIRYTERTHRCLSRIRHMEGSAPFTVQVTLAIAAPGEQPEALIHRALGTLDVVQVIR